MGTATDQNIGMTVFELQSFESWQNRVETAAQSIGAGITRKGAACQLWMPNQLLPVRKTNLHYADGVKIVREWLGPRRNALAIIPHRVYFEPGANTPSIKPERVLIEGARPALPSPDKRISSCLEWARILSKHIDGFNPEPITAERVRHDLHKSTQLIFGGGAVVTPGSKLSFALMSHGSYSAPARLRIELVAPAANIGKAKMYQTLLANALKRCKCHGVISMLTYDKMLTRLQSGTPEPTPGACALLAVTGKKGLPLAPEAETLINLMTKFNIPFRMFSVDNPALNWSALDQAGSLITGAGGVPFITKLPWPDDIGQPFILGVDVGHPPASKQSQVVVSLMDYKGVLLGSWRQTQPRDETIHTKTLQNGLTWTLEKARSNIANATPSFLVLRDGRLHKGENPGFYSKILGTQTTLLEFSKHNTPEMFIMSKRPTPVKAGTECLLTGSSTPYITPIAARLSNDLARSFKINMPAAWDGLGLGIDKVSEIVVGLSYTPGLGLAPHALPGPIYWADGIAAICEHNHQFAGQNIVI